MSTAHQQQRLAVEFIQGSAITKVEKLSLSCAQKFRNELPASSFVERKQKESAIP
jgi:hypothetical protein